MTPAPNSTTEKAETPESIQRGFILEDLNDSMRWLSEAMLNSFSAIELNCATSVKQALQQLEAFDPDIALIDLALPDGSGLEVIRWLSQNRPRCLIIVSTVFADDQHLFGALSAGAGGYILKDQSHEQLQIMLQGIASGQPPLSPSVARRLMRHFQSPASTPDDLTLQQLTEREKEVLTYISKGYSTAKTAQALNLSPHTVAGYIKEIYRKLNVNSRAEAALIANRKGLLQ